MGRVVSEDRRRRARSDQYRASVVESTKREKYLKSIVQTDGGLVAAERQKKLLSLLDRTRSWTPSGEEGSDL